MDERITLNKLSIALYLLRMITLGTIDIGLELSDLSYRIKVILFYGFGIKLTKQTTVTFLGAFTPNEMDHKIAHFTTRRDLPHTITCSRTFIFFGFKDSKGYSRFNHGES
jgi:hypothetical protein